ncbi:hypothetical protein [Aquipuribacter sp. SD81]|uniref:hypothetical protein n=1 Tax=Aquipuribacter sp. SD81 TaxID=3127703 RepID=UPI0030186441
MNPEPTADHDAYECPPPPAGITERAAAFWSDFHDEMDEDDLDPDARETAILTEAVRAMSTVDRLEDQASRLESVLVPGSTGNERVHPVLAEIDKNRKTIATLLTALKPPADRSAIGRANAARRRDRRR